MSLLIDKGADIVELSKTNDKAKEYLDMMKEQDKRESSDDVVVVDDDKDDAQQEVIKEEL